MFLSERIETEEIARGRYRASCYGAPVAYRRDGSLRGITNTLAISGDPVLTIGVDELVQFRVRSRLSGNAPVVHFGKNGSYVRWTPLDTANVDGVVDGNTILFPEAWSNADLRLAMAGHRLQKEIVLRAGHPLVFRFRVDDSAGLDLDSLSTPDFRILPPVLTHPSLPDVPLTWLVTMQGGKAILTVALPVGDWSGWTLDPTLSAPSDAADAHIYGGNADYATARSTTSSQATTGTKIEIGQASGATIYVYRGFLKFDTSSIPDDATVTQVNLKLTPVTDGSTTDFNLNINKQDWSAQDPIAGPNREAAFDNCLAATLDQIWRNTSGMSINTQYTSPNMDTTWISLTGATYYSLISDRDVAGTEPTTAEYLEVATAENATEAYRPVLDVIYTTPGGAGHQNLLLMGVG